MPKLSHCEEALWRPIRAKQRVMVARIDSTKGRRGGPGERLEGGAGATGTKPARRRGWACPDVSLALWAQTTAKRGMSYFAAKQYRKRLHFEGELGIVKPTVPFPEVLVLSVGRSSWSAFSTRE